MCSCWADWLNVHDAGACVCRQESRARTGNRCSPCHVQTSSRRCQCDKRLLPLAIVCAAGFAYPALSGFHIESGPAPNRPGPCETSQCTCLALLRFWRVSRCQRVGACVGLQAPPGRMRLPRKMPEIHEKPPMWVHAGMAWGLTHAPTGVGDGRGRAVT